MRRTLDAARWVAVPKGGAALAEEDSVGFPVQALVLIAVYCAWLVLSFVYLGYVLHGAGKTEPLHIKRR